MTCDSTHSVDVTRHFMAMENHMEFMEMNLSRAILCHRVIWLIIKSISESDVRSRVIAQYVRFLLVNYVLLS